MNRTPIRVACLACPVYQAIRARRIPMVGREVIPAGEPLFFLRGDPITAPLAPESSFWFSRDDQ